MNILALIPAFLLGIGFVYVLLRSKEIGIIRLDHRTFLLKIPLLGSVEARTYDKSQGFFISDICENQDKVDKFKELMDFDILLRYGMDYNINYVGFEGDKPDGSWTGGKLACSTLAPGETGGYNIFLNPALDRKLVCQHLRAQTELDIQPDELYNFLFLHEIGHTEKAGNESYIKARISHSLRGSRKARRWQIFKELHNRIENFADEYAKNELLKWRKNKRKGGFLTLFHRLID
jgi:hypothetical protein